MAFVGFVASGHNATGRPGFVLPPLLDWALNPCAFWQTQCLTLCLFLVLFMFLSRPAVHRLVSVSQARWLGRPRALENRMDFVRLRAPLLFP